MGLPYPARSSIVIRRKTSLSRLRVRIGERTYRVNSENVL
jgi:hypothetical protein